MVTISMIVLAILTLVLPQNLMGFILTAIIFVINLFVPDMVPLIDEMVMLVSLMTKIKGIMTKTKKIEAKPSEIQENGTENSSIKWE